MNNFIKHPWVSGIAIALVSTAITSGIAYYHKSFTTCESVYQEEKKKLQKELEQLEAEKKSFYAHRDKFEKSAAVRSVNADAFREAHALYSGLINKYRAHHPADGRLKIGYPAIYSKSVDQGIESMNAYFNNPDVKDVYRPTLLNVLMRLELIKYALPLALDTRWDYRNKNLNYVSTQPAIKNRVFIGRGEYENYLKRLVEAETLTFDILDGHEEEGLKQTISAFHYINMEVSALRYYSSEDELEKQNLLDSIYKTMENMGNSLNVVDIEKDILLSPFMKDYLSRNSHSGGSTTIMASSY